MDQAVEVVAVPEVRIEAVKTWRVAILIVVVVPAIAVRVVHVHIGIAVVVDAVGAERPGLYGSWIDRRVVVVAIVFANGPGILIHVEAFVDFAVTVVVREITNLIPTGIGFRIVVVAIRRLVTCLDAVAIGIESLIDLAVTVIIDEITDLGRARVHTTGTGTTLNLTAGTGIGTVEVTDRIITGDVVVTIGPAEVGVAVPIFILVRSKTVGIGIDHPVAVVVDAVATVSGPFSLGDSGIDANGA